MVRLKIKRVVRNTICFIFYIKMEFYGEFEQGLSEEEDYLQWQKRSIENDLELIYYQALTDEKARAGLLAKHPTATSMPGTRRLNFAAGVPNKADSLQAQNCLKPFKNQIYLIAPDSLARSGSATQYDATRQIWGINNLNALVYESESQVLIVTPDVFDPNANLNALVEQHYLSLIDAATKANVQIFLFENNAFAREVARYLIESGYRRSTDNKGYLQSWRNSRVGYI